MLSSMLRLMMMFMLILVCVPLSTKFWRPSFSACSTILVCYLLSHSAMGFSITSPSTWITERLILGLEFSQFDSDFIAG